MADAELVNITSTQPMKLKCIDFLSLEMSKGGHRKHTGYYRSFYPLYPGLSHMLSTHQDTLQKFCRTLWLPCLDTFL